MEIVLAIVGLIILFFIIEGAVKGALRIVLSEFKEDLIKELKLINTNEAVSNDESTIIKEKQF